MNANELAYELETGELIEFFEKHTQYWKKSKIIEAAIILRQQQAEIEALKAGNEPVAWINTRISDERPFLDWEKTEEQNYLSVPLYTHPHPDNLGLAESIIKQQKLEIERLKTEIVTIEKNTDYWADKANWIMKNE